MYQKGVSNGMSRTGVHKTTHLHRMAFASEQNYEFPHAREFVPTDVKIQKGCRIAGAVLRAAEDPQEQDYLNRIMTPALLGSAWRDAFVEDVSDLPNDLMYRVVELPRLDTEREKEDVALKTWLAGLVHVEAAGDHQPFSYNKIQIDNKVISLARTRRSFRSLTSASLWLGAIETARNMDAGRFTKPEIIQEHIRENGYEMTRRTYALARKIGYLPTIGQLDDAYSPLTVEFMRSGPSHLRNVYLESREVVPKAA